MRKQCTLRPYAPNNRTYACVRVSYANE